MFNVLQDVNHVKLLQNVILVGIHSILMLQEKNVQNVVPLIIWRLDVKEKLKIMGLLFLLNVLMIIISIVMIKIITVVNKPTKIVSLLTKVNLHSLNTLISIVLNAILINNYWQELLVVLVALQIVYLVFKILQTLLKQYVILVKMDTIKQIIMIVLNVDSFVLHVLIALQAVVLVLLDIDLFQMKLLWTSNV